MKQLMACIVAIGAVLSASAVLAQTIPDADIEAAIKAGNAKKFDHLVSDCIANAGFGGNMAAGLAGGIQPNGAFTVTISTNAGRIAYVAADAKRLYKSFTLADVSDGLKQPAIFVFVDPHKPSRSSNTVSVASPIERVVLKSKTQPDRIVQPETFATEPVEWSNLLGGRVEANRAIATFSIALVRELPPGDFDVVAVTQAGERRCKVGEKDRAKLFPLRSRP